MIRTLIQHLTYPPVLLPGAVKQGCQSVDPAPHFPSRILPLFVAAGRTDARQLGVRHCFLLTVYLDSPIIVRKRL